MNPLETGDFGAVNLALGYDDIVLGASFGVYIYFHDYKSKSCEKYLIGRISQIFPIRLILGTVRFIIRCVLK